MSKVGTADDAYFEDPDDPEGSKEAYRKAHQLRLSETKAWVLENLREKFDAIPKLLDVQATYFVYRGADGRDWYQDILDAQGERTFVNFPMEWDAVAGSPKESLA